MANRHYGKIGDIWKHLPLAEILTIERPARYWESHAGSAYYPLTHSAQRDYGIYHFLSEAHESRLLEDSAYYWLTSCLAESSETPIYPGSPGIALATLDAARTQFVFCDTDQDSLTSIRNAAQGNEPAPRVETVCGDGLVHMRKALKDLSYEEAADTLLFIDPYDLLEPTPDGFTALGLFCEAARRGVKTILWFGYSASTEYNELIEHLDHAFRVYQLDTIAHRLWMGHVRLESVQEVYSGFNPGVWGCAVLCANLSHESLGACAHLGQALDRIYRSSHMVDNTPGAICFQQAMFGVVSIRTDAAITAAPGLMGIKHQKVPLEHTL